MVELSQHVQLHLKFTIFTQAPPHPLKKHIPHFKSKAYKKSFLSKVSSSDCSSLFRTLFLLKLIPLPLSSRKWSPLEESRGSQTGLETDAKLRFIWLLWFIDRDLSLPNPQF